MRIVLAGLSHKTAPVQLRERLSFYGRSQREALYGLRDAAGLAECALLSTCNRTEIYGLTAEEEWQERILDFLASLGGVSPAQLQEHLFAHEGTPATRHLFRVSAGLDSMVMGEGQVLAQVKEAFQTAQEAGTAGPTLNALFQHAITAGKRVRTETEIGRGAVSISLAAVQLARSFFPRLAGHTALLLGAGETADLAARMLFNDGKGPRLLVCNRTLERGQELARRYAGSAMPGDQLTDALTRADFVISTTAAPHPLITVEQLRRVMRARRGRPLFLIDIAVPRDVEPEAGDLDDVYLYNIDHLQAEIAKTQASREDEARRAEPILEEELGRFRSWMRVREVGPTIRELQSWGEAVAAAEMERLGGRLSHLNTRDREVIATLARGMVQKLLRPAILRLKEAAESGNGYQEVEQVRALFDLPEAPTPAPVPGTPEPDTQPQPSRSPQEGVRREANGIPVPGARE